MKTLIRDGKIALSLKDRRLFFDRIQARRALCAQDYFDNGMLTSIAFINFDRYAIRAVQCLRFTELPKPYFIT